MREEVVAIGTVVPNPQGILEIGTFIKLQSIVTKYGVRLTADFSKKHAEDRREFLKEKKFDEYQKSIQDFSAQQRQKFVGLTRVVMEAAGVPQPVFANSGRMYG